MADDKTPSFTTREALFYHETIRPGKLEVVATNSTLVQELGYQKPAILKTLTRLLPDAGIKNVRFRVGTIE